MKGKLIRTFLYLMGLVMVLSLTGCMEYSDPVDSVESAGSVQKESRESVGSVSLNLKQIDEFHRRLEEGSAQEYLAQTEGVQSGTEHSEVTRKEGGTQEKATFLMGRNGFAYDSLNEAERIWYQDIAECLGQMQEEVSLNRQGIKLGMDETDIDRIFQCVLMDHPELFYVDGYSYTKYNRRDKIIAIRFSGNYAMDRTSAVTRKAEIEAAVTPLLTKAAGFSEDYDKVRYVYETIIKTTEYDLNSSDNQNIYSVFVNHSSVCQGYAKAVQYLLNQMGVECALVQGSVDTGEGHAWNLVKVNGSYYYVDATWGDASYQAEDAGQAGEQVPDINYDYLCITTEQLLRTHILDSCVPMPACVDTKDNYFVREGALFTTYDREQMRSLFENAFAQQKREVTVKCSDIDCFRQILEAMTEGQEIFEYLEDGRDSVIYTHNEKQLSMTFWVTSR